MKYHFLPALIPFLCALVLTEASGQQDLQRLKVTKDISMKVPVSFNPMSRSEMVNKYVAYRQPIAMFTSADRQIDLGINKNSTQWTENDLTILKDFYKANIQNLFTEVKFIQEEVKTIGNREFVVFEFISKVTDEDKTFGGISSPVSKYTYIMYTLYQDSVLLFNFSCDTRWRPQWQAAAREIMESVRINS
ncbi:MAG: hypothetical protein ABJ004_10935 [Cyclobacteriaceae bacterium]